MMNSGSYYPLDTDHARYAVPTIPRVEIRLIPAPVSRWHAHYRRPLAMRFYLHKFGATSVPQSSVWFHAVLP